MGQLLRPAPIPVEVFERRLTSRPVVILTTVDDYLGPESPTFLVGNFDVLHNCCRTQQLAKDYGRLHHHHFGQPTFDPKLNKLLPYPPGCTKPCLWADRQQDIPVHAANPSRRTVLAPITALPAFPAIHLPNSVRGNLRMLVASSSPLVAPLLWRYQANSFTHAMVRLQADKQGTPDLPQT